MWGGCVASCVDRCSLESRRSRRLVGASRSKIRTPDTPPTPRSWPEHELDLEFLLFCVSISNPSLSRLCARLTLWQPHADGQNEPLPRPPLSPSPTSLVSAMSGSNSEGRADRYAKLAPVEILWRDRQQYLESRGYMLRPRYRPGWQPSWKLDPTIQPRHAEDSLSTHVSTLALYSQLKVLSVFPRCCVPVSWTQQESRTASSCCSSAFGRRRPS